MFKKLILVTTLLPQISFGQLSLDLGPDLEVPDICENIADFVTPVDLSAACLSAQIAAQSNPLLLPSANRLCQILEGTTATLGVIQLEINTIYEKCQLEMGKIETELTQGISEYSSMLNDLFTKRKRLLDAPSFEELEAKGEQTPVAGLTVEQWEEELDQISDRSVAQSRKRLIREVAKSNYVADQFLVEGVVEDMVNIIVQLLNLTGSDVSIKESQDLQVRMGAELVYQQQAFLQIINQYMALVAIESEQELNNQRYLYKFLGMEE